jgi:hypothetical protein
MATNESIFIHMLCENAKRMKFSFITIVVTAVYLAAQYKNSTLDVSPNIC